jgi:hypothetical protein
MDGVTCFHKSLAKAIFKKQGLQVEGEDNSGHQVAAQNNG